jgi:hypothetical protein
MKPCNYRASLDLFLHYNYYHQQLFAAWWFILGASLPKGDQISKLFWFLSHLQKKPHNHCFSTFLIRLEFWWPKISVFIENETKMKLLTFVNLDSFTVHKSPVHLNLDLESLHWSNTCNFFVIFWKKLQVSDQIQHLESLHLIQSL